MEDQASTSATDEDMAGVAQVLLGPSPLAPPPPPLPLPSSVIQRSLSAAFAETDIDEMVKGMDVPAMASPADTLKRSAKDAEGSPAKKKARQDVTECVKGDIFVDKDGTEFTKEQQIERVQHWLKSWDKRDDRSHVTLHLEKMWLENKANPFSIDELRYMHGDKKRYISARGMCNGHEVKGFPVFEPVRVTPKGIVKQVRFSGVLVEQLELRDRLAARPQRCITRVECL